MGKNIKIICTVVPNGLRTASDNKRYADFSVFLTPRLPDSGRLKDYYEICNWFKFVNFFRDNSGLSVCVTEATYNSAGGYTFSDSKSHCEIPISFDTRYLDSMDKQEKKMIDAEYLWTCIFKPDCPIRGWILDEGLYKPQTVFLHSDGTSDEPVQRVTVRASSNSNGNTELTLSEAVSSKVGRNISIVVNGEARNCKVVSRVSPTNIVIALGYDSGNTFGDVRDNTGDAIPLARTDIQNNVMSKEEIIFRNKENQEFHRKISILADYPHLLRAMGWILDFSILLEKTENADPVTTLSSPQRLIRLSGLNSIPNHGDSSEWEAFVNEIDFKTPWTYYRFDHAANVFEFSYAEELQAEYYAITNRYIHQAKSDAYTISAYQYNKLDTFRDICSRLDSMKADLSARDHAALKDYFSPDISKNQSEGIVIKVESHKNRTPSEAAHNNQPGEITIGQSEGLRVNAIGEAIDNLVSNINDYILFGHNLDNGYVIEVKDTESKEFKSLCKRVADYKVDISKSIAKNQFDSLVKGFSDEGWISEVAVAGKSGRLYVREEICRWNNWSLVCPQLGKYVQDEKVKDGFWEYNDLELTNIKPQPRSLVPLRFGKSYVFRIRMIDICGNGTDTYFDGSTPFRSHPEDSSNYHIGPVTYKRMEPVGRMEFFFCEKAYKRMRQRQSKQDIFVTNDHYRGEREDVLAIRSEGGDKVDNLIAWFKSHVHDTRARQFTDDSSERSFCPARVSAHYAEIHGALDNALNSRIVYEKAAYHHSSGSPEYFRPGEKLPFITDPVVKKVKFTLRVLGKLNIVDDKWMGGCIPPREQVVKNYPEWNPNCYGYGIDVPQDVTYAEFEDDYLSTEFKSIILECVDKKLNSIETVGNTVYVNLKPGTIGHVYVAVCRDGIQQQYITREIFSAPDKPDLPFAMLKKLTVVHAVKKPISYCSADTVTMKLRDRYPFSNTSADPVVRGFNGDNNVDVLFQLPDPSVNFPFSTASEIVLRIEYAEIVIDKSNPKGFDTVKKTKTKSFSNLHEKIDIPAPDKTNIYEQDLSVDDILMPLKCTTDRITDFMTETTLKDDRWFAHSFGDTKYRNVTYTLEGISRFRSFFPEGRPEDFVFSRVIQTANHVLNSKKMKAPAIHSLVPMFKWEVSRPQSVQRTNHKFRIYFSDDWYESGEGEKVAVIFYPDQKTIPDTIQELTSSYGRDPIRQDESTNGLTEDHFSHQICIPVNSELLNFEPKDDREILNERVGKELKAAIFDVKFDDKKKLFFTDIQIVPDKSDLDRYMPFLKLAICRYQEHSICRENRYDFRFSKVAMAPQVQLMPARTINWDRSKKDLSVQGSLMPSNEFYLRCVNDQDEKIIQLDNPTEPTGPLKALNSVYVKLRQHNNSLIIDDSFENRVAIARRKLYLEEYEVYKANDAAGEQLDPISAVSYRVGQETKQIYDPSNDLKRRLVFSCDLSIIE